MGVGGRRRLQSATKEKAGEEQKSPKGKRQRRMIPQKHGRTSQRVEELGSVCQIRECFSNSSGFQGEGWCWLLFIQGSTKPTASRVERKTWLLELLHIFPVQRVHLTSSLWVRPSRVLGHCCQVVSLHTTGAVQGTPSPVLWAWACCPWPSSQSTLQASLGGCFLCFADGGLHPLF